MNILVTGASGFVGSALAPHLVRAGHHVIPLRRGELRDAKTPHWNPQSQEQRKGQKTQSRGAPQFSFASHALRDLALKPGEIDLAPAGSLDAVIHLAGENIAQRWTAGAKVRLRESRVDATQLLSTALARLDRKPRVLVCASATGFYGNRGDEVLTEASSPGHGFLAGLCQQWEAAARPAAAAGIRVVLLRFGILLDRDGGALKKMLPAFRLGIAGRLGSGQQYWSWATRADAVRAIEHTLNHAELLGPVNVVAPEPVTNARFTSALSRVLRRPAMLPAPAFALRALLGEMADEALLSSARVLPKRLEESGFNFEDPQLEPALRKILAPC